MTLLMLDLLKYSRILEGMNRNASKHAAGVVITPGEVSDHVSRWQPMAMTTHLLLNFNMKELEEAGSFKNGFSWSSYTFNYSRYN